MSTDASPGSFGPNAWLIDEMFEQFRVDPTSVSETWREYFADYRPLTAPRIVPPSAAPAPTPATPTLPVVSARTTTPTSPPAAAAAVAPAAPSVPVDQPKPLRGVAAKIVENMQASLTVPTATSVRDVPARLLEVNRTILNNHLQRTRGGKVSFTHLIAYAMLRALHDVPSMNSSFAEIDGQPTVTRHSAVNLGIAVDLEKSDGSRTLMVPSVKGAEALTFEEFWLSYEELIRKVRTNKVTVDDLTGATVTLTNPGGLGTVHSVPRLMPGQGVIVGVGSIDYPAEYAAADLMQLARFGISKVITLTSTYDHRVIQGAESGVFLQRMHKYLIGEDGFYDDIFRSLEVPYEPARWQRDINPEVSETSLLTKQVHVQRLIDAYRTKGHLLADLDPLGRQPVLTHPELDPVTHGISIWDLDRDYFVDGLGGNETMRLGKALGVLRDAYCRTVGIEYMHIADPDERNWLRDNLEGASNQVSVEDKRHILDCLNGAEAFERFLHTRYVGQKRFGLEGAESAVVVVDAILEGAVSEGFDEAILGMAHRGRLNILINCCGKGYNEIFREFEGHLQTKFTQGSGDVKYHLGVQGKYTSRTGGTVKVSMASNPSHLEAVNPVVEGMVRAKQDALSTGDQAWNSVLPLLIHGDAAMAGQGIVFETLQMANLPAYRNGGTVHLIINNQLGFTTDPVDARSSQYCSDVAKSIGAPIFHVNADDPEACLRVARLAFAYRQKFHKDVVIDLVGYRKFGHNEGDEPSYTQPQMYAAIDIHRSVRLLYTDVLVKRGDITVEQAEAALDDFSGKLQVALDETRGAGHKPTELPPARELQGVLPAVQTGVDKDMLDSLVAGLHVAPEGFTVHPKLIKQLQQRTEHYNEGEVDWALGEQLAYGTLVLEGNDVRLVGEDTERGTFSHRHAVLNDYVNGAKYTPLMNIAQAEGRFEIYNSLLSEYAALGFEYGYSTIATDTLVIWEAQFGDFINGAQVTIDQFVASGEEKWSQSSGMVLLLPHGHEGQGPEHSSARPERFLQLCANDNMQVVNCTTSAQLFHVLRRQVRREVRKPLIVMSPKSLLRAKTSRSNVAEFVAGTFHEVLDDPAPLDRQTITRVILSSGKVAFDAMAARDERNVAAAVVRVEQLYPWPADQISEVLSRYPAATELVWLQEEPENQGAWSFVQPKLWALAQGRSVYVVSRLQSASPATGSMYVHGLEQQDVLSRALSPIN